MPSREGGKGSAEGDELRQRAQVPKSCFTAPSPRAPDRGMAGYAVSRRLLEESLEVANITLTKGSASIRSSAPLASPATLVP